MLLRRWRAGAFTLIVSEHILAELVRAFANPFFTSRLSAQQIEAALAALRAGAVIQPITFQVTGIATHLGDDLVLATALSAGAGYIVTGDKRLQELDRYHRTGFKTRSQPRDTLNAARQAGEIPGLSSQSVAVVR